MAYRKFSDVLKEERATAAGRGDPRTLGVLAALDGGQADTRENERQGALGTLATLGGAQPDTPARAYAKQQRYLFDIYTILDQQEHISPHPHGPLDCDVCAPAAPKAAKPPKVGDTPQSWVDGCRSLPKAPPAPDISPERWRRIVYAADRFLDRWAEFAIAAGWSTLDVFGADPDRPGARFDAMGLVLLLDGCRIVDVDEHGADLMTDTGAKQRYRRRPLPTGTIPLWELRGRR